MGTSKKIKLIYELYENDIAYHGFEQETNIDDVDYNKIVLDSIKDVVYDKTDIKDIKLFDGRDVEIQNSIIQHPLFTELLHKIIEEIETNNSTKISFFCNHGKHRSVGWTEILKKYYPNSIIKHSIE